MKEDVFVSAPTSLSSIPSITDVDDSDTELFTEEDDVGCSCGGYFEFLVYPLL